MSTAAAAPHRAPHPVIWTILYLPFGALGGFISVAMMFMATHSGLSITEGSLLGGAQMLSQWLKWSWAPIVDVTSTPKRWYIFATAASAVGVFSLAAVPLGPDTLPLVLGIIAVASLINTIVGMAIEAILAQTTTPGEEGRVSAWFQSGNLGGTGLGGALGLFLLERMDGWLVGVIMGSLFLACCTALMWVPDLVRTRHDGGAVAAVRQVFRDILALGKVRGGLLAALIVFLPLGTGAGQGTLVQATVAEVWGAGATQVELVQGLLAGGVTVIGCFVGGWLCDRLHPRTAYATIGLLLAGVGALMGLTTPGSPWAFEGTAPAIGWPDAGFGVPAMAASVWVYIFGNMSYSLVVGFAYAAFTAVVLNAIGSGSAATKYSLYASLSNFPIWWLGLLLGRSADLYGPATMLYIEAAIAVIGVIIFWVVVGTWHEPADATVEDDVEYLRQRYGSAWGLASRMRMLSTLAAITVWMLGGIQGVMAWNELEPAVAPAVWLGGSALLGVVLLFGGQVLGALVQASTDSALLAAPLTRAEKMAVLRGSLPPAPPDTSIGE